MSLLTADILSKSLLELLEMPGLISIPDIINKMQRTMKKFQQCLEIPDYKFPPFRRDRSNKVGGGVIVYVKNTVNCIIRPDLHVGSLECIWLEIKLNNKKYLYGTFYIPPTSDLQTWRNIEHSIDLALNCN
jgi:hypothetical protein